MKVKSIVDRAVKRLEDMIIKGKLEPGQRIKETEISTRLGISRPPLREAFKILEAEGLIRREPRHGVFVSELTEHDIWEVYTLKIALYTLSVRLAMERITPADLVKLEKTVKNMEELVDGEEAPDIMRYEELNSIFHDLTASTSGHVRLRRILQSLNNQIKRISYKSFADIEHLRASCVYHRMILEAIKAGDTDKAEDITREHILRGLEVQKRLMASREEAVAQAQY